MSGLQALLSRGGLPANERLLVLVQCRVEQSDRAGLEACLGACRTHGVDREQVEELLLQAVLFSGFPRVVNGFRVLQDCWPAPQPPAGGSLPPAARAAAGRELFETIYQDRSQAVRDMLRACHGELHDFVLDTAYGRILCRPGLPPRLRELVAVAVLALTGQVPQLIAHGRGARNFGASDQELREAVFTALGDTDRTESLIRRI